MSAQQRGTRGEKDRGTNEGETVAFNGSKGNRAQKLGRRWGGETFGPLNLMRQISEAWGEFSTRVLRSPMSDRLFVEQKDLKVSFTYNGQEGMSLEIALFVSLSNRQKSAIEQLE